MSTSAGSLYVLATPNSGVGQALEAGQFVAPALLGEVDRDGGKVSHRPRALLNAIS